MPTPVLFVYIQEAINSANVTAVTDALSGVHVDPVNIAVMVGLAIAAYRSVYKDVSIHARWIEKHDEETSARQERWQQSMNQLIATNARLVTLTESHQDRLNRLEDHEDARTARH